MYQELRFAVLSLAVAMSTAQAQEQEGKFIIGPRDFSCGKWTNTPKNTAQHDVQGSWVFGYLSGINAENSGVDFLRGREPDALLHHSDRGSQYTSEQFLRLMADSGVVCSMSRLGNVWDNAAMESFFSSLKIERTSNKTYRTRNEAKADVFDYIERFYNSKRRHS